MIPQRLREFLESGGQFLVGTASDNGMTAALIERLRAKIQKRPGRSVMVFVSAATEPFAAAHFPDCKRTLLESLADRQLERLRPCGDAITDDRFASLWCMKCATELLEKLPNDMHGGTIIVICNHVTQVAALNVALVGFRVVDTMVEVVHFLSGRLVRPGEFIASGIGELGTWITGV